MQNFQDTFETRKRLFISAFSICMTVPLKYCNRENIIEKKGNAERIKSNLLKLVAYMQHVLPKNGAF